MSGMYGRSGGCGGGQRGSERDLDRAPSHRAGESARFDGRYSSDINSYYGRGY